MPKLSKLTANLRQFFITYFSTVRVAWATNKRLFARLTLVNAINGSLVYPRLLVTKMLIDAVMTTLTNGDINSGIRTMLSAAILTFVIDQINQLMWNLDNAWSYTMSNLVGEKISLSISRKINALPVGIAELPETRNTLQKVMDNPGAPVCHFIFLISFSQNFFLPIISAAIPIVTYQPLLLIPSTILAIPGILVGIRSSRDLHDLRTKQAPLWRVWGALEDFAVKGRFLYENKILDHVDVLLKRRQKMALGFYAKEIKIRLKYAWQRQGIGIPVSIFETGNQLFFYYQAILRHITLGTAQMTSTAVTRYISNVTRLIRQINDVYQNYLFIQDYAQYPFSAKDNIHFGDITKKSKISDIRTAAKLTGVHHFISSLPLKYRNPLDKEFDKGIDPSKGQWQRIALARSLFREAPIIILDEPSSNVDPETEEQIFGDILRVASDKIILLVSHRFSTVRKADKILVLEEGIVKEYGNHESLTRHHG